MDIRGVEITNQLRSAIRAKLLELGVRYDDELPDYILVMVVNKKSRSQMNEDLNLFLEDSTEPFVNWLHDQVLKKLQKVTVAKKKSNKDPASTAIVKQEDQKKPKIEDEPPSKSDTPTREPTKVERDKEFDDLVGDLAMLNEDDGKSNSKELEADDDDDEKSQNAKTPACDSGSSNESSPKNPERRGLHSSVSIPESSSIDKPESNETLLEKVNNTSSHSLKRMSNDDSNDEKTAHSAKRSKFSNDSDSENDNRVKSSVNKPKISSVISVQTILDVDSPPREEECQTKSKSDVQTASSNKNEISSQSNSSDQSKSIDRRKPQTEDLTNELQRDNKHPICNSNSEKSSRIEETTNKAKLSSRSGTIKSRLGVNSRKKAAPSLKSTNSTKVSKPRISNVRSRLGIRSKQQGKKLLRASSKISKISQKHFEEDSDTESVIVTSLKSHIIAVQKSKSQKRKQTSSESLNKPKKIVEEKPEEDEDEDDDCKILSKIIVTPRPLQPLKPVQKRATQSLLLKAVAEANQSVVMQKKVDPCLKEQAKPTNKIKITRDPWEGKVVSVSLNGKKRNIMEKIQVELTNPDKSKTKKSQSSNKSQIVTDEHMDVVKSLFKRSDDKQKFLVTLNGYNNNVDKEKNSDDEDRLTMEIDDDDEISLINNQYDAYEDEVQIIENDDYDNDPKLGNNQDIHKEYTDTSTDRSTDTPTDKYTDTPTDKYTDKHTDKQTEKYADKYTDKHSDKYADKYTDKKSDKYSDKYTDKKSDKYTDKYRDKQSDKYADKYTDKHSDKYTDKYTDRQSDKYADKYTDKQSDKYKDKYRDKYTDKYRDKYTDKYTDKYADKYTDKQSGQYTDNYTDRHCGQYTDKYTDKYTDRQSGHYTDTQSVQYTDNQSGQYTANQAGQYTAKQPDPYINRYMDIGPDQYTDIYTEKLPDQNVYKYTDRPEQYIDNYTDKQPDQYIDKYIAQQPDQYTVTYTEKPPAQYIVNYTEKPSDQYTDTYTNKQAVQYSEPNSECRINVHRQHLKVAESFSKSRRKISPIVYTRARSISPGRRPRVASTVTSFLRIKKRPLVSSIIKTVAGKSSEKCRYWPSCTLGIKCAYYHPEVLCSSFPACKFGEKCAYKHPKCKFGSACTKLGCKFSHPPVKCKYHPYCMKPGCPFSHPKASRSSSLTQPLTPDMSKVRAKFTWKKQ